jgi:hypothetical protein
VAGTDEIARELVEGMIYRVEAVIESLRQIRRTLESVRRHRPPASAQDAALRNPILVLVAVWPAPVAAHDEYHILAQSLTDAYHIPMEPSVVGQYRLGSAQALKIQFGVLPRGSQNEEP